MPKPPVEGYTTEGSFLVWSAAGNLHCVIKDLGGHVVNIAYWSEVPTKMVETVRDAVEKVFPRMYVPNIDPLSQGFRPTNPDSCSDCSHFAADPVR